MNTIRILSAFGVLLAFVVIALGAWTRLADAGLGCPDWPGCYGFVTFPTTASEIAQAEALYPDSPVEIDKIIPEVVHRYFAASLGLLAIVILFFSLKNNKHIKLSAALLTVIIGQGIFGYLTVSLKLYPLIVTGHLFGAMIVTSIFLIMFLNTSNYQYSSNVLRSRRTLIYIGVGLVLGQIFLGAWTSTNYAARACLDFPLCQGQLIPPTDFSEGFNFLQSLGPNYLFGQLSNEARVAIHLTHRIGAVIVLLYSIFLATKIYSKQTKLFVFTFLGILGIQIFLGINNIISSLPLWNAVAHNMVGVMLFLWFVVMIYFSYKGKNESGSLS
jgi:cytochrome c oxidase assembly protein subunit 15